MTTPLEQSKNRIENLAPNTYAPYATYRYRRSFRYSDRRLFKKLQFLAMPSLNGVEIYAGFLGPSGVTLAAKTGNTYAPTKTWVRYPVSYRRRTRFLSDWANATGSTQADVDAGLATMLGEGMTIFMGDEQDTTWYIKYLNGTPAACVAAAKGTGVTEDEQNVAKQCCGAHYSYYISIGDTTEANKWDYTK